MKPPEISEVIVNYIAPENFSGQFAIVPALSLPQEEITALALEILNQFKGIEFVTSLPSCLIFGKGRTEGEIHLTGMKIGNFLRARQELSLIVTIYFQKDNVICYRR